MTETEHHHRLQSSRLSLHSIRFRLMIFLLVGVVLLLGFLNFSRNVYSNQNRKIFEDRLQEHQVTFDNIYQSKGELLHTGAVDYTYWDDMVNYVKTGNNSFVEDTLQPMLATYKANSVDIYKADFSHIFAENDQDKPLADFDQHLTAADIKNLFATNFVTHYYVQTTAGILEVYGATIVPTNDPNHLSKPSGYLFVSQLLGSDYVANLSKATRNEVSIIKPGDESKYQTIFAASTGTVAFKRDIIDLHNKKLGQFYVKYTAPGVKQMSQSQYLLSLLNATSYVLLTAGLFIVLWLWVLSPINRIYSALQIQNINALQKLVAKKNEFSDIARLLIKNFELEATAASLLERSKDEFAAIASHELRTPLSVIQGNASLLRELYADKMPDKDMKQIVTDIEAASKRLSFIVSQFLIMSSLEQGKVQFTLSPQPVDVPIKTVIEQYLPLAQTNGVKLTASIEPNLPLASIDTKHLTLVLDNLVSNAIKYTQDGSIDIKAAAVGAGEQIKLTVSDTGKGIEEGNQNQLFNKFQQATDDRLTRDNSQSAGLGLYIARLLMEQMGGKVDLEYSSPSKGSAFSITLPVASEAWVKPVDDKASQPEDGQQT